MSNRFSRSREIRIGGGRRRPSIVLVLLILSLLLNVYLLTSGGDSGGDEPDGTLTEAVKAVAEGEVPAESGSATPAPVAESEAEPDGDDDDSTAPDDSQLVKVVIEGPVANAFVKAIGKGEGDRVALTAGRLLTWNLDVSKDPRRGDVVEVQYRVDPLNEAEIHIDALRYTSAKFRKTFEAYRYQPEGWMQPSWFDETGAEVPARLKDSPIEEYEQITALLGDGRRHSGMDFKAPVGTPITSPFDGSVRRVNWNLKYNGYSVEVAVSGGKLLRFLHLEKVAGGVQQGARVIKGQVIATSGNTGRSFAPHLHYEIVDGNGRVHDPLDVHGITRRSLEGEAMAAFEATREELVDRLEALD